MSGFFLNAPPPPLERGISTLSAVVLIVAIALTATLLLLDRRRQRLARERAESRRSELELRSAYLSKFAPDAIFLADDQATILEANDRALEMYGRSREELVGRHGSVLFPPRRAGPLRRSPAPRPRRSTTGRVALEGRDLTLVIARDVSERQRLEEQSRPSDSSPSVATRSSIRGSST